MAELTIEQKALINKISFKICEIIDENEAFIIKHDFNDLLQDPTIAKSGTYEKAWTPDPEVATYALLVVIFLRDIFLKAVTDKISDKIANKLGEWMEGKMTEQGEIDELRNDLISKITSSHATKKQKTRLIEAILKALPYKRSN